MSCFCFLTSCLPNDDFINAHQLTGDDTTLSSSMLSRKHGSQLVSASQLLTIGHCQTLAYLQPPMLMGCLMLFLIPERDESNLTIHLTDAGLLKHKRAVFICFFMKIYSKY